MLSQREPSAIVRKVFEEQEGLDPDRTITGIFVGVTDNETAMHLLQSGAGVDVIALWLGHESPTTTHHYVEADLAMKERALARLQEPEAKNNRYHASDALLEFLKTL